MAESLNIGPPHTAFDGMNTTFRRAQLRESHFHMMRNVRLFGEGVTRAPGNVRLFAGARTAKSLKSDGAAGTYVTIPYQDSSVNITDYDFGVKFTVFAAYRNDKPSADNVVAQRGTDANNPPFAINHPSTGRITGLVTDSAGTTVTVTSTKTYSRIQQYQVLLIRDGATVKLQVNGDAVDSQTGLSTTLSTKANSTDIYLCNDRSGTGGFLTLYEYRMFRAAITDDSWRVTQYPNSGRFGDPKMVCHLTFEDGTGTALTDYSRINNASIATTGSFSWLSTTLRQVVTPVTGIHVKSTPRGRRWLLADVGPNHYRIELPG